MAPLTVFHGALTRPFRREREKESMTDAFLSTRRLYLWHIGSFVAGTACGVTGQFGCCLLVMALLASVLATVAFKKHKPIKHKTWLIICLLPLVAFAYARLRLSSPSDCYPLLKYAGRSAIVVGELKEKQSVTPKGCQNYLLEVKEVLFPERRLLDTKVLLSVRAENNSASDGKQDDLPLAKPLTFKVTIRQSGNSYQEIFEHPNSSKEKPASSQNSSPGNAKARPICFCSKADIAEAKDPPKQNGAGIVQNLKGFAEHVIEASRKSIVNAHVGALARDKGCLLSSMVLGDRAIKLPDTIVDDFRTIGLSHILAASGFNLTLVITMSCIIGRTFFATERRRGMFSLLLMLLFVLLTGLSASIVRAAIMCFFLVGSRMVRRQSNILASIASSILITVIVDPPAILDLGLQLSYAATIGITSGARPLADLIQISTSRAGQMFAELSSVCLLAQLSVLPIQVFAFWNANMLFLISNLLILPLVGPITIIGFISSIIALCTMLMPGLSTLVQYGCNTVDSALNIPLSYILCLAHFMASLQWAKVHVGQPALIQVVLYYTFFLLFLIALHRHWQRLGVLALALGAIIVLLIRPSSTPCSIGIFSSSTVIINSERDAVILSRTGSSASATEDLTVAQDKIPSKFLAFNAVREALPINCLAQNLERQNNHSIAVSCDQTVSIYTDQSKAIGVVHAPSADALPAALAKSSYFLGLLRHSAHRFLIVRCDRDDQGGMRKQPERVLNQISHLMSSCGAEEAILVFTASQHNRLWPIIRTFSNAKVATTSEDKEFTPTLTTAPGLTSIKVSRRQLARLER